MTQTRKVRAAAAAAITAGALLALPSAASAVEFTFGTQANLEFGSGATSSSGEGFANVAFGDFSANAWIGSLPGDSEYELSLSYGTTFGNFAVDATYTAYFVGSTGYDTQDIAVGVGFPIVDKLAGAVAVAYDLDASTFDVGAGLEYAATDKLTFAALVGHDGTGVYWEAGATYGLPDNAYIGLLYEDNDYEPSTVTLSIGIEFGPYGG